MCFATLLNSVLSTDRYSSNTYETYVSHTEYKCKGREGGGEREEGEERDTLLLLVLSCSKENISFSLKCLMYL